MNLGLLVLNQVFWANFAVGSSFYAEIEIYLFIEATQLNVNGSYILSNYNCFFRMCSVFCCSSHITLQLPGSQSCFKE